MNDPEIIDAEFSEPLAQRVWNGSRKVAKRVWAFSFIRFGLYLLLISFLLASLVVWGGMGGKGGGFSVIVAVRNGVIVGVGILVLVLLFFVIPKLFRALRGLLGMRPKIPWFKKKEAAEKDGKKVPKPTVKSERYHFFPIGLWLFYLPGLAFLYFYTWKLLGRIDFSWDGGPYSVHQWRDIIGFALAIPYIIHWIILANPQKKEGRPLVFTIAGIICIFGVVGMVDLGMERGVIPKFHF